MQTAVLITSRVRSCRATRPAPRRLSPVEPDGERAACALLSAVAVAGFVACVILPAVLAFVQR